MKSSGEPGGSDSQSHERDQEIADFLTGNPSFFERHPNLLMQLELTDQRSGSVSLIERQVRLLRDENKKLQQRLDGLIGNARENDAINRRINELVLRLMNAVGVESVFSNLEAGMRDSLGAEQVECRVFADPSGVEKESVPQFLGVETPVRDAFSEVLESNRAACGGLTDDQSIALFDDANFAGSAVVLPLAGKNWDGILVIAHADASRYQPGMGTDFLMYLRDVVVLIVDPWIKHRA